MCRRLALRTVAPPGDRTSKRRTWGGGAHYNQRMIINNSTSNCWTIAFSYTNTTSGQRLTFWLATCSRDVRPVNYVRKLVHRLLWEYCFSTQRHNPHTALRRRHRFYTLLGLFRSYSTLFVSLMQSHNMNGVWTRHGLGRSALWTVYSLKRNWK
jgi:hypothetical protein